MSELFNVEKMEKSIKKAKRRSTWKTVLITVVVLGVVSIVGVIANRQLTYQFEQPVAQSFYHFRSNYWCQ